MIYLQYQIIVNYRSRPLRSKALQNPKKIHQRVAKIKFDYFDCLKI